VFQHVDVYPGDPILTLNESFADDPRPNKVNLSIGVFLDDSRRLPIMGAVLEAETAILKQIGVRPYLPMEGAPNYRKAAQLLVFGEDSPAVLEKRIATVQTIGGSGALKVGADFLKTYFGKAQVWVCDPTWDNHRSIFSGAGFQVNAYPYYSPATQGVDFEAMKAALQKVPEGDIVLLHACCHNPTGADLTEQQWRELVPIFRERRLLPFFDIAYQGFGEGIAEDAFAIRHFTSEGMVSLTASSFSKNFSLYGERCGSLNVVCPDGTQAENVLGQLKAAVRRNYSSPPTHGARIVAMVLQDMRGLWEDELGAMRGRILAMRSGLYSALHALRPDRNFDYLLKQKGMFSYTGLSQDQVRRLREEFGVYLIGSGRMCMAALTQDTIAPVAEAIAKVLD
jgi:aromatic-amino-acid transaminase